jgi:hypothetical protein
MDADIHTDKIIIKKKTFPPPPPFPSPLSKKNKLKIGELMTLYSVKYNVKTTTVGGYTSRHKEVDVPLVDLLSSLSLPEIFISSPPF